MAQAATAELVFDDAPADMPISTSPMDGLIEPIRASLHPRRYGLKNRERTNRLLELVQLHANRQDDVLAYAEDIRAWLEANQGRPGVPRRAVDRSSRQPLPALIRIPPRTRQGGAV